MDGSVDARDPIRIMGEKLAPKPRITMHTDRGVKLRLRAPFVIVISFFEM